MFRGFGEIVRMGLLTLFVAGVLTIMIIFHGCPAKIALNLLRFLTWLRT